MHAQAFPKRSDSTGRTQKAGGCPERRQIMARRNGFEETAQLLTQCPIGKSPDQRVERPKLQPARPLSAGDRDGTVQRSGGGFGFPAAIGELAVDSPELGLEIALIASV